MSTLLAVHAHPDDETITQGGTLARYAAQGHRVVLVTCTRGEQGEVIPPELAHLFGSPDLGPRRVRELAAAMAELGVAEHRFLDGLEVLDATSSGYVDSGMAYAPDGSVVPVASPPPGAFALADVGTAARSLAGVLREVGPDVVTTYDPVGGYGHPDHVRTHVVTMRALELEPDAARRVYWIAGPGEATRTVDAEAYRPAKVAAMRAHATQLVVADDEATYALSNHIWHPLTATEHYRQVSGPPPEADLL